MNDPRYQDLIAKSAHDVEGTEESAPMPQAEPTVKIIQRVTVERIEERQFTKLKSGRFEIAVFHMPHHHPYIPRANRALFMDEYILKTDDDFNRMDALLQEARRQMGGE